MMKPIHKWLLIGGITLFALTAACCGGMVFTGIKAVGWMREAMYPKPKSMPPVVAADIAALLKSLDAQMQQKAPKSYARLAPGLTSAEISALETKYNYQLSPELKQLYMWRNGEAKPDEEAHLMPFYIFPSLENALKAREEYNRTVVDPAEILLKHQRTWLCVMGDDDFGGYYYDSARTDAQGALFFTLRDSTEYTFVPSVRNLIAGIVECYEKGYYHETEDGLEETEDTVTLEKVWDKYEKVHEE